MVVGYLGFIFLLALFRDTSSSNMNWMNSTLRTHLSINRHHVTNPGNKRASMQFIQSYMKDTLGLDVFLDVFKTINPHVNGTNVIGLLKGVNFGTTNDKYYGIGAHYDTMRNTSGVDDNGSGVTIMLDAATSLVKDRKRKYSLFFVAFDFEEWENSREVRGAACDESTGIGCGSSHFVNVWIPYFALVVSNTYVPQFGGIFVMDTMWNYNDTDGTQKLPSLFQQAFPDQYKSIKSDGFDGDFVTVIGRLNDTALSDKFKQAWSPATFSSAEIETVALPISGVPTSQEQQVFSDFFRSDHIHFWSQNFPAVFLTDTADKRGYMVKCYHHPCDEISHLTNDRLRFMAKSSDALYGALNDLTRDPNRTTGGAAKRNASAIIWAAFLLVTLHFGY